MAPTVRSWSWHLYPVLNCNCTLLLYFLGVHMNNFTLFAPSHFYILSRLSSWLKFQSKFCMWFLFSHTPVRIQLLDLVTQTIRLTCTNDEALFSMELLIKLLSDGVAFTQAECQTALFTLSSFVCMPVKYSAYSSRNNLIITWLPLS